MPNMEGGKPMQKNLCRGGSKKMDHLAVACDKRCKHKCENKFGK